MFSCGCAKSLEPTITPELLRAKTAEVRTEKYLKLKREDSLSHFKDTQDSDRNQFIREMKKKETNNAANYVSILGKNYENLRSKVEVQEQEAILQKELNRYRLKTAAVAVGTAALGTAAYFWSCTK